MALVIHGVIAVALIVAYTVVTVTGNDGVPLLTLLGGYVAGVGTQAGLHREGAAPPP